MGAGKVRRGTRKRRPKRSKPASQPKAKAGLPAAASVIATKTFTSASGARYRILKTTEADPYDRPTRPRKKSD